MIYYVWYSMRVGFSDPLSLAEWQFFALYPVKTSENGEKRSTNKKDNDKLEYVKHTYNVPIECLISENNPNLYGIGRIISADFDAHAALRTQMSCFSMGEAAAKDIFNKIKN